MAQCAGSENSGSSSDNIIIFAEATQKGDNTADLQYTHIDRPVNCQLIGGFRAVIGDMDIEKQAEGVMRMKK